jgi:hypothetical protein
MRSITKLRSLAWSKTWSSLPRTTRENSKLYREGWNPLPEAAGLESVRELLTDINDIRRLCGRFALDFDEQAATWPVITVEFSFFPKTMDVACQVIFHLYM